MKSYREMSNEELKAEIDVLMKEYRQYQNMDLKLNMSRGKPCLDQLDLSMGLMDVLSSEADMFCEDGTDCRNYGVLPACHHSCRNDSRLSDHDQSLQQT
jgi:hypothetical protein